MCYPKAFPGCLLLLISPPALPSSLVLWSLLQLRPTWINENLRAETELRTAAVESQDCQDCQSVHLSSGPARCTDSPQVLTRPTHTANSITGNQSKIFQHQKIFPTWKSVYTVCFECLRIIHWVIPPGYICNKKFHKIFVKIILTWATHLPPATPSLDDLKNQSKDFWGFKDFCCTEYFAVLKSISRVWLGTETLLCPAATLTSDI